MLAGKQLGAGRASRDPMLLSIRAGNRQSLIEPSTVNSDTNPTARKSPTNVVVPPSGRREPVRHSAASALRRPRFVDENHSFRIAFVPDSLATAFRASSWNAQPLFAKRGKPHQRDILHDENTGLEKDMKTVRIKRR